LKMTAASGLKRAAWPVNKTVGIIPLLFNPKYKRG